MSASNGMKKKATTNFRKHKVKFELACEAFFDPFVCYLDEQIVGSELRERLVGLTQPLGYYSWWFMSCAAMLFVLSPLVWWRKQKDKYMKTNKIAQRLQKNRPMTMVSIRIPADVIEDLKRVAPMLGFSGYQVLIKAYIGQGLRADLERLESSVEVSALIKSLRKKGVKEEIISSAMAEAQSST